MPFEKGNKLAANRRMFEGVVRRAIAQDNAERLRRAVERLLDSAADGETWAERLAALQFIAERTDGKVLPMMPDAGDGTLVVSWVMHGTGAQASAMAHTITGNEVATLEHRPSEPAIGTIAARQVEEAGHAEIAEDGGVGGGGGTPPHTFTAVESRETPPHTSVTPVPDLSDSAEVVVTPVLPVSSGD